MHRRPLGRILSLLSLALVLPAGAAPVLTTLVTFNGTNGANPYSTLIADAAGNLYGTTDNGGASVGGIFNNGSVFEIAAGTHAFSQVATFNGTEHANPFSGLVSDAAGNLYGTTNNGGAGGFGSVYEIAAGTHALSTVATFSGGNGSKPYGGLIADAAGNLYGTTFQGGINNKGTVFKIAAGTHAQSTLATFNGTNGATPYAGLSTDASGNLYGTTFNGGTNNVGTVFKIAAGTNALSTLATFDTANGKNPLASLVADAKGNLYGTTYRGGLDGYGTVFEIAAGSNAITTLVNFNDTNGANPEAGLIFDAAGNLYGTTGNALGSGYGTVFKLAAGTHALTTLATFNNSNGADPRAALYADAAGNLYGTTSLGGAKSQGTVFELSGTDFVTATAVPLPSGFVPVLIAIAGLVLLNIRRKSRRTLVGPLPTLRWSTGREGEHPIADLRRIDTSRHPI